MYKSQYFMLTGGVDKESWCLNSDGTVRHDNIELYHLLPPKRESPTELLVSTATDHEQAENEKPESDKDNDNKAAVMPVEGDVIGVVYDHVELNFFINGKNMEIPVRNIKGTVYPALYGKYLFYLLIANKTIPKITQIDFILSVQFFTYIMDVSHKY